MTVSQFLAAALWVFASVNSRESNMQRAVLNRATIEVANTTDISGRVTAESINDGLHAKKQSSHWRMGASQFVLHGTHSGSFMDGTAPTGRTVAYPLARFAVLTPPMKTEQTTRSIHNYASSLTRRVTILIVLELLQQQRKVG